jgi:hypothetical protein
VTARPNPAGPLRASPVGAAVVLLLTLLVASCATTSGTVAPGSSANAGSSASADAGGAAPSATPWPGDIVEAVVILGKADAQIQAAGADLGAAAAYEDLDAMWGAADGLATLLQRLETQVPRIKGYPETAAAAAAYEKALPAMLAGATQLRDSIKARDAAGITAGSQQLAQGLQDYQQARVLIGPLVDRALLMQKLLLK